MDVLERFLKYISIPTNSTNKSESTPSTDSQKGLAELLVNELKQLNLDEVYYDEEHCYVYGVLKGNSLFPKIGFISHLDTSEEVTDKDVKPRIINNYDGKDIKLNKEIILSTNNFPELKNYIGKTIVTTDGTTLLGADDKAGIAEIMAMLEYFVDTKEEHGDIYVAFTPDEEIGKGTDFFDFSRFKADFAYTADGSDVGEISYENFNAATAKIQIEGISTHTGSAKDKMINSILIANEIMNLIPNERPENTEGYEGFYHLNFINGSVSNTEINYLIRDFDKNGFENRKQNIKNIIGLLNEKYNYCIKLEIIDTYYNMKDKIVQNMDIIENTKNAVKRLGIKPTITAIRGGTDGAEITKKAIPCPNLGIGAMNFHSIYECACVEDMQKACEVMIEIIKEYTRN